MALAHQNTFCGFHISIESANQAEMDPSACTRVELPLEYAGNSPDLPYCLCSYGLGFAEVDDTDSSNSDDYQFLLKFAQHIV